MSDEAQGKKERADSPCVAVCSTLYTEYCLGCGRHFLEVANWTSMSQADKDKVWERITQQGYPKRKG